VVGRQCELGRRERGVGLDISKFSHLQSLFQEAQNNRKTGKIKGSSRMGGSICDERPCWKLGWENQAACHTGI
jgi:hypothetical protein